MAMAENGRERHPSVSCWWWSAFLFANFIKNENIANLLGIALSPVSAISRIRHACPQNVPLFR
jgi:hypothetical protein